MSPEIRRARLAFIAVGVIAPLVMLAIAAVILVSWLPELPDPVAIHWSGAGPDGFAAKPMVFFGVGLGAALVVLFAVLGWFGHRMPQSSVSGTGGVIHGPDGTAQWSLTARMLGGANLGLAALLAWMSVLTAGIQRGLADAADAPDISVSVWVGLGLLLVVSVLGWFLQPSVRYVSEPRSEEAIAAADAPERWEGTATMGRSGIIVLGVGLLVILAATVLSFAVGGGAGWITAIAFVVVALAVGTNLVFRVRADAAGLRVRSLLGWPNTVIAASDIASVRAITVNPFAEFGGWGWRYGLDGRRGVVLRAGEALEVTRTSGTIFVVTVDGAATAAAVLRAAATREA